MKFKPNQIKRSCKRSPIGPIQAIQGKSRDPKRSTKTQRSGSGRTERAAATTGSLWCSPRPVVEDAPSCYLGRMAMCPLLSGGFIFLHALSSSQAICRFCLLFFLYDECIWLILHPQFLSFHHSSSSFRLE